MRLVQDGFKRKANRGDIHGIPVFWSLWESARWCVESKLNTSFGDAKRTFVAFDGLFQKALELSSSSSKSHARRPESDGGAAAEFLGLPATSAGIYLLLWFFGSLERHIHNAIHGSLTNHVHTIQAEAAVAAASATAIDGRKNSVTSPPFTAAAADSGILGASDASSHTFDLVLKPVSRASALSM